MTQKERLVARLFGLTLPDAPPGFVFMSMNDAKWVADHLLANDGVIVPPCKVGDKVYVIFGRQHLYEGLVTGLRFDVKDDAEIEIDHFGGRRESCIGTTVFFTREEAEQALKEREKHEV